jgi:hypothetical protein
MPERRSPPGGFRESCDDGGCIHAEFGTRPLPILGLDDDLALEYV